MTSATTDFMIIKKVGQIVGGMERFLGSIGVMGALVIFVCSAASSPFRRSSLLFLYSRCNSLEQGAAGLQLGLNENLFRQIEHLYWTHKHD